MINYFISLLSSALMLQIEHRRTIISLNIYATVKTLEEPCLSPCCRTTSAHWINNENIWPKLISRKRLMISGWFFQWLLLEYWSSFSKKDFFLQHPQRLGGPLFNPFLLKYCFLKLLCRENDDNWQKYF